MTQSVSQEKTELKKLNLGCGYRQQQGYENIDNRDLGQKVVFDIAKLGLPYDDNSITEVRAFDFLEHIPIGKTIYVIEEIYRVLVPDGLFEHYTPSTDGRGAFQDPTHVSFWNINSWFYFMDDAHRDLYGIKAKFRGINTDVVATTINFLHQETRIIHTHGKLYAVK